MSLDVESIRQMNDQGVKQFLAQFETFKSNNQIMKKMLKTMEGINDIWKKRFKCRRNQTINNRFDTKLNVLNKIYTNLKNELVSGTDSTTDSKSLNNLVVVTSSKSESIDESIDEDVCHSDLLSDDQIVVEFNADEESSDDISAQMKDNSIETIIIKEREVRAQQMKDKICRVDDCLEYCCEFSDTKTGILCQKKFRTRDSLINHVFGHSGEKPWFCEIDDCEYRSVLRSHLIGHIRKSHTGRHQFLCDWPGCDFRGPSRYNVKRHKIIHTNEKPYKCDWPGCDFRSPNNKIAEHKRIHTGEKPFECPWVGCESRFSRQFTLRNHIRTHTGEKPFKCDYPNCQYSSTQQTPLATHKRKHHNSSKESSEEIVFTDNIVLTDE